MDIKTILSAEQTDVLREYSTKFLLDNGNVRMQSYQAHLTHLRGVVEKLATKEPSLSVDIFTHQEQEALLFILASNRLASEMGLRKIVQKVDDEPLPQSAEQAEIARKVSILAAVHEILTTQENYQHHNMPMSQNMMGTLQRLLGKSR